MRIKTHLFEESHGRKPRQSQRGTWVFTICRRPGEATDFTANGTYADAAREAKAEARQIGGASQIMVQP